MKKVYYININNKEFKWRGPIIRPIEKDITLYDCYEKPSDIKKEVWRDWIKWANNNDFNIWVNSYNVRQFTIMGIGIYNTKEVVIYITRTRQEIYNIL